MLRGNRAEEGEADRRAAPARAGRPDQAKRSILDPLERFDNKIVESALVWLGKLDSSRRRSQTDEVLVEPEGLAGVDARRLEGGAPAQERLVVGAQHGLGRIDEAASEHGQSERGHGLHTRTHYDPARR